MYKGRGSRVSQSSRAGLQMPVARFRRMFLDRMMTKGRRLGRAAPVYIAAVVEYLIAEILELAGNAAKACHRKRINPRFLYLTIHNDEELLELLKHVTIPESGTMPYVHEFLVRGQTPKANGGGLAQGVQSPAGNARKTQPAAAGGKKSHKAAKRTNRVAKVTKVTKVTKVKLVGAAKGKIAPSKANTRAKKGAAAAVPAPASAAGTNVAGVGFTILSEKKLTPGQKLTVVQGDIVQINADAVVHPTGGSCGFGGEVGQALKRKGGRELQNEINKMVSAQGSLKEAEVAICPAHNIPAKYIIHVNSPTWNNTTAQTNLETAIKNILSIADTNNLSTIALPSVSSGNAGFPKQTAAHIILTTINSYFTSSAANSLKQIYFVLYDMESIGVYTSELAKLVT